MDWISMCNPASFYGLRKTSPSTCCQFSCFWRTLFFVAYTCSWWTDPVDFRRETNISTCIRLFVFLYRIQSTHVNPAISFCEAVFRSRAYNELLNSMVPAVPNVRGLLAHAALNASLVVAAAVTIINKQRDLEFSRVILQLCRIYVRYSVYAIAQDYIGKASVVKNELRRLTSQLKSQRVLALSQSWTLIRYKTKIRDQTRCMNDVFGLQVFLFYSATAVHLSVLVGKLIISWKSVNPMEGLLEISPILIECLVAISLAFQMSHLGSDIVDNCLEAEHLLTDEGRLADELRVVLAYREQWDSLRLLDSVPNEVSAIMGAVINIITFVAIVLQFDVTVSQAIFDPGHCKKGPE
ncbi:uncharacterized protein LOC114828318 [Galendromus occidentalis]|uniref:Uncharacterized protein LOC114828318 n=1 Tax=Galendromus occidentalis TaxID=34638 RepID=A0AAJ7SFQ4_9ACAR|nr:uncharacterized protein LOC114828318 [Galendromus occidentalis]